MSHLDLLPTGIGSRLNLSSLPLSTVVSLAVVALLGGISGCQLLPQTVATAQGQPSGQRESEGAVAVETAIAQVAALDEPLEYTGTTQPFRQISLRSQAEGRLLYLSVDVGDRVPAGEVLAQLDDRLLNTDVNEAQAELAALAAEVAKAQAEVSAVQTQVEQARIELQQLQTDAERLRSLFQDGVITQQQAEQAQTAALASAQTLRATEEQVRTQQQAVVAAQRRVTAQQAVVAQTQERQAYSTLVAPVAGTVLERVTEPGNLVQPGNEILKLGDFSAIKIRVQVSELELSSIQVGQPTQIRLDAFPEQLFAGEVTRISPAADPTSRLVPIEVTMPNGSDRISSGLLARVQFQSSNTNAIVIPERAFQAGGDDNTSMLFVVRHAGETAQVEARRVRMGATANGKVEICSGLQPGDAVVIRSSRPLKDGQAVRLSLLSEIGS